MYRFSVCTNALHMISNKMYSTSYLSCSGSLVQPLHIPLLTDIQWSVHKHFKERQPRSLVNVPGIQAILTDNEQMYTR